MPIKLTTLMDNPGERQKHLIQSSTVYVSSGDDCGVKQLGVTKAERRIDL